MIKVKILLFNFLLFWGFTLQEVFAQQLSVAKFGAIPNDTINDREAIQKAVDYCKNHRVKELLIPPGQYIISEQKAIQLANDIMDGKFGSKPQDVVYTPYYPYTKGIHFYKQRNLTVQASGALFIVYGWMEPVSIENSSNITINGLTVDYATRPHSEGLIVNDTKDYFDVKMSPDFPVKENMVMLRIMFWDKGKNRLHGTSIYFPEKNEIIAPGINRIWAPHPKGLLGSMALINHNFCFRPGILINESQTVNLNQVTIHAQPGNGIVGHRSENIIMNGLRIVPRAGEYQSVNTDATHFASCKGLIRFDGCSFEGQGDDATNVHNYYQVITRKNDEKTYTIQMEKKWGTHAMVLDFPDVYDTFELVSRKTLQIIDKFVVAKCDTFPQKWETVIRLNRSLPTDIENYYLIDVTRLPRLEFVNSYVGSHLARAVLVKTRHVLVENCTLRETTGTAIHIGAEGDWREGPGSANVTVRNNRIIRCGRGDGTNNDACAIAINVKAPDVSVPGIHKNILIEGNLIEGEDAEYGISVSGADKVTIRNNEFAGCKAPLNVQYSTGIKAENNYIGTSKMKDIIF